MQEATVDPFLVRFSRASISRRFKTGETIDDLAEGLRNGTVQPGGVPSIRLVERGGLLFTLDNRRLEAFRRAGADVPYRMATAEEFAAEESTFTTANDGVSVRVRG